MWGNIYNIVMQKITEERTKMLVYLPEKYRKIIFSLGLSRAAGGISYTSYITQAVKEKLERDGHLPPSQTGGRDG